MKINRDKYAGVLVGKAIGDAIGYHGEGGDREIAKRIINAIDDGSILEFNTLGYDFGQYTDDTQLTRELLRAYEESGKLNLDRFVTNFLELVKEHRIIGIGIATLEAAMRLQDGVHWSESGCAPPKAGNGTAMRSAAIAMISPYDDERLMELSKKHTLITQKDPRCLVGSIIMAKTVAEVMKGNSDMGVIIDEIIPMIHDIHPSFALSLNALHKILPLDPLSAATRIINLDRGQREQEGWPGISPYVVPSVIWSMYSFFKQSDDFLGAIKLSIFPGGDIDTTGAMTGAIAGAHHGMVGIPKLFARKLNDHGEWRMDDLIKLAHDTHRITHSRLD